MSYNPQNPNGQATMANSAPVVLASNQTDIKVTLDGETVVVASSGLPSGAATETTLASILVDTTDINNNTSTLAQTVYHEDDAAAADPFGTMMMAVADTNATAGVGIGDNVALRASLGGALFVNNDDPVNFSVSSYLHTDNVTGDNVMSNISPGQDALQVAIFDQDGTHLEFPVDGSPAYTNGIHVVGTDGTNARIISTNVSGHVNIADGGNIITVDGTVAATQSGNWSSRTQDGSGNSISSTSNALHVNVQNASLTVASHAVTNAGVFVVQENGASLTALQLIDDTVFVDNAQFTDNTSKVTVAGFYFDESAGTALTENDVAAARIDSKRALINVLEDGTTRGLRAGVVDETGTNAVDALAVGGGTPHDSVDSGNPVKVGFKAANALPTAIANSDRANGISDLWGRQLVSHIDPAMQVTKAVNVTTTQTGTDVWSPTSGKKIAVTYLAVSAYATTAARVILWFGDNADTTYTAGTDQVLWAGSFAPSTTAKPMMVIAFPTPIFCTTADRELHLTTDAGISLDITVYGYEW